MSIWLAKAGTLGKRRALSSWNICEARQLNSLMVFMLLLQGQIYIWALETRGCHSSQVAGVVKRGHEQGPVNSGLVDELYILQTESLVIKSPTLRPYAFMNIQYIH